MKFKLDFEIPESKFKISHSDSCVFIGSCFSEEISQRMNRLGFKILANPFGILFHPNVIAKNIANSLNTNFSERILQQNDLFFSWDCNRTVYEYSQENLQNLLKEKRENLVKFLNEAKYLIVTFGTSNIYKMNQDEVANCHKVPQNQFSKLLTPLAEMCQNWNDLLEDLKVQNPNLKIIFTVSPVRHIKDGIVENSLSKARLINLVHELCEKNANCIYFPSYEIMVDELRDHRHYNKDLIHPNTEAIDYIFQKFQSTFFSQESSKIISEIEAIKSLSNHKVIYDRSILMEGHKEKIQSMIENFKSKHKDLSHLSFE